MTHSTIDCATGDRPAADDQPPSRVLTLDVVRLAGDWKAFGDVYSLVEETARVLAESPETPIAGPASACVALSSDAEVTKLNSAFRGIDKPTNVLSFSAGGALVSHDGFLGDIVLAAETIVGEANEQGTPVAHHFQHLVLHGLLHLAGYDHKAEPEAERMEALEIGLLARLGIANPYGAP